MSGLDYIIEAELTGPLSVQWIDSFSDAIQRAFGRWAVGQLDVDAGRPGEYWGDLDNQVVRAIAVSADPQIATNLAELLVVEGNERHRALKAAAARAGMSEKQSVPTLRKRIVGLVPRWLSRPEIVGLTMAISYPGAWDAVADEIGRTAYEKLPAWAIGGAATEWQLINHLLLAEYFRQCRLPTAALVAHDLLEAGSGLLSLRGSLVNTSRWISRTQVGEAQIPISGFKGHVALAHSDRSALVACVERESMSTATGNGFMGRIAGPHTGDVPEAVRAGQVDAAAWLRGRRAAYLRYERTVLAFMGLASIWQIVRAYAVALAVPIYRSNDAPIGIPKILKDPRIQFPEPLKDRIRMLFDSGMGNVRNRVIHGVFIHSSSKRLHDNLVAGGLTPRQTAANRDPHTPENIAGLVLDCLQYVDRETQQLVALTPAQLDWGGPSRLTSQQFNDCASLVQDLMPNDDRSNAEAVEDLRRWLSAYFRVVMPGLGQFFRLGYIGFMQRHSQNTLPRVHGFAVIFEATYRLTCHLVKVEVVDKGPFQNTPLGKPICIQYRCWTRKVFVPRRCTTA